MNYVNSVVENEQVFKTVFNKYAGDDGELCATELKELIMKENLCNHESDAEKIVNRLFAEDDANGDQKFHFEEFYKSFQRHNKQVNKLRESERKAFLKRIFNMADVDQSGTLSREEIFNIGAPTVTEEMLGSKDNFEFEESLGILSKIEKQLQNSVRQQTEGLFHLFDSDYSGYIDKSELREAVSILEDIVRVFKRVNGVWNLTEGTEPNSTDKYAPIPNDRFLGIIDVADLFIYYHFRRLEKNHLKKIAEKETKEAAAQEDTTEEQQEAAAQEDTTEEQQETAAQEDTTEVQQEAAAQEDTTEEQQEAAAQKDTTEEQQEVAAQDEMIEEQQEAAGQE